MKRSTDRILTTHVGSLVRPPALIDAMRRLDAGDPLPQPEYETLLRDSVSDVVRDQAANGVDVPSDGEFGKRGWTGYVVERLSGVEPRLREGVFAPTLGPRPPRLQRVLRRVRQDPARPLAAAGVDRRRRRPQRPHGHGDELVRRRAARLQGRRPAAARHRQLQGRARCRRCRRGLHAGRGAAAAPSPGASNEYYQDDASFLYALSRRAVGRIPRHRRCRAAAAGRRRLPADRVRPHRLRRRHGGVPALQHGPHRGAEPRAAGHPAGPRALPRLLGQLERPALHGRAAQGHRRPRPAGQRRRLLHRGRQPGARARMGGLADDEAARTASR